jgi:hypothetical protein
VHEQPAVIRKRRITVGVVLVIGAVLLGLSLTREPGDTAFYWLTLAMAAVWTGGGFISGPLQMGSVRYGGRRRNPALVGTAVGLAIALAFVGGALVARQIPGVREYITDVLIFANQGALALVVFITVVNGLAEEVFFRGALYSALGPSTRRPRRRSSTSSARSPRATRCSASPRCCSVRSAPMNVGSPAASCADADPLLVGAGDGAILPPLFGV